MADDEKLLRIEATIREEGKKDSDKPIFPPGSAGDILREKEIEDKESRDRETYDELEKDKLHEQKLEDILEKIVTDEDFPIVPPGGAPPGSTPPTGTIPSGGGVPPVPPPPGSPTPSPAPGAPPPPGGTPPATPPGVGPVAAPAAAALEGFLLTLGIVTAVLVVLGGTIVVVEQLFDSLFRSLSRGFEEFSGQIQMAEALKEVELMQTRLEETPAVEDEIASATEARTGLEQEVIRIRSTLVETLGPGVETLIRSADIVLTILNMILRVLNLILWPTNQLLKGLNKILSFFNLSLDAENPDQDAIFAKDAVGLLSGITDIPLNDSSRGPWRKRFSRAQVGRRRIID